MDVLEQRAACMAQHTGLWCARPEWLQSMVAAVNAGLLRGEGQFAHLHAENRRVRACLEGVPATDELERGEALARLEARGPGDAENRLPFYVTREGIAVIEIVGPMMKGDSKFVANANTIRVRRALRAAAGSDDVAGIMLLVDSPGGHVAGTEELANDVAQAAARKPLHAHADDLMASAAYWASSPAARITAGQTAEVGSIGTLLVVDDWSQRYAEAGVKVHVISTGPYKGTGVEGAEVTDEQLAYLRQRVESLNAHFLGAVEQNRGLAGARLAAVSDGRVFIAEDTQQLGLVDAVQHFDDALEALRRETKTGGAFGPMGGPSVAGTELRTEDDMAERNKGTPGGDPLTAANLAERHPDVHAEVTRQARDEALQAERQRVASILALSEKHSLPLEMAGAAVAGGESAERLALRALEWKDTERSKGLDAIRRTTPEPSGSDDVTAPENGGTGVLSHDENTAGREAEIAAMPEGPEKWSAEWAAFSQAQRDEFLGSEERFVSLKAHAHQVRGRGEGV